MIKREAAELFNELFALFSEIAKSVGFTKVRFKVSTKLLKRSIASGNFSIPKHNYHEDGSSDCVKFAFYHYGQQTIKIKVGCEHLRARLSFVNNKASRDLNKDINWYSGVMILLEIFIAYAIVEKTKGPTLSIQDKIIVLAEKIRNIV